jgi:Family of unknown function (DUF6644)
MLHSFFEWMSNTSWSIALHESVYLWPSVESVHVLTLGLFVGFAAMLDLRLLGVAFMQVPVSEMTKRLLPWTSVAFVVMVISGVVVFYANPLHFYHNVFFRVKLLMLILAGINVWVFHGGIWRRIAAWDTDPVTPRSARVAGAASLLLWTLIIFAGRAIAYNWFDCDAPQSAFINWVTGCAAFKQQ